jgi:hypothetical protein
VISLSFGCRTVHPPPAVNGATARLNRLEESVKAKLVIAMLVVLAIPWMIAGSRARASADSDKAEIVTLNQRLAEAFDKRGFEPSLSSVRSAQS